ncbi:MAG: hypothetical protein M3173_04620, partial [Chloroflexota bacterium]|nr:hypothetical protein [Chloroflexota bacterium]
MSVIAAQTTSLRTLVRSVTTALADDRSRVLDMSRATSLELDPTLRLGSDGGEPVRREIRRLEGPIEARRVERHQDTTPIRYFLDGSQRTLPVWRVGPVPIVVAVTAAGILRRTAPDEIALCDDTLVASLTWVVPRHTRNEILNRIVCVLEDMGQRLRDPFEETHQEDPDLYGRIVNEYLHCLEGAYATASNLRAAVELDLLRQWERRISPTDREGWIVVDGRLQSDIPNAIGLVKSAQAQHLQGREAVALFDLPIGHRTTAYALLDPDAAEQWDRTMWYLRMQNAIGQDARHGLVRLETPAIAADIDLIDHISSWVLAERAPRASTDARWATQIYPIHLLERMLKRRI